MNNMVLFANDLDRLIVSAGKAFQIRTILET